MFKIISDKEVKMIHEGSLALLKRVGVEVPHEETLKRLAAAGALVDFDRKRVRIPEEIIFSSLEQCGKSFILYGIDPAKMARFGCGEMNFNSIAGEAHWLEEETMTRRYTVASDVDAACRVGEALEHIDIVGAMSSPQDAPPQIQDVIALQRMVKNTTKPVTFWFTSRASAAYICEMLAAVAGSEKAAAQKPLTCNFFEPISPLRFPYQGIDLLYETARFPLPVSIGPMVQAGATGPATLAGTLTLENAEILVGICITQLISPGVPVCYGGIPHIFDMKTTQMVFSGPEQALMAVAMIQMGKFYGLPVYTNTGLTDSKIPDAQAGMECALSLIYAVNAGSDIFGHLGICGVDQAASLSMLIMQNEIIGFIKRMKKGIKVTEETLALDVIESVGIGGNFLAEEHTLLNYRNEFWFPELLNRDFFETWKSKGAKDMAEVCRDKKEKILKSPPAVHLDDSLSREIDRIAASAKRNLS